MDNSVFDELLQNVQDLERDDRIGRAALEERVENAKNDLNRQLERLQTVLSQYREQEEEISQLVEEAERTLNETREKLKILQKQLKDEERELNMLLEQERSLAGMLAKVTPNEKKRKKKEEYSTLFSFVGHKRFERAHACACRGKQEVRKFTSASSCVGRRTSVYSIGAG